jgi:hypothetical protein
VVQHFEAALPGRLLICCERFCPSGGAAPEGFGRWFGSSPPAAASQFLRSLRFGNGPIVTSSNYTGVTFLQARAR